MNWITGIVWLPSFAFPVHIQHIPHALLYVPKPCVFNHLDVDHCRGANFSQLEHVSEFSDC